MEATMDLKDIFEKTWLVTTLLELRIGIGHPRR